MLSNQKTLVEILKACVVVLGANILPTALLGLLNEDDRGIVIGIGLILAFISLVTILISIIILALLDTTITNLGLFSAAATIMGVFGLSEVIILLVPQESRTALLILGLCLGCLAFILIIITIIILEILAKFNITIDSKNQLKLVPKPKPPSSS
jgi:hypothetical protein